MKMPETGIDGVYSTFRITATPKRISLHLRGAKHKTASSRMHAFLEGTKQVEFARGAGAAAGVVLRAGQDQTDAATSRAKGAL